MEASTPSGRAVTSANNLPSNPSVPSPLRLLIVEDDPVMQLGLQHALQQYPHLQIVGQETQGYLGVEVALTLKPDVVIMDIGLPQLNGIAATQQIKAALPNTKIVILTSHNTEHETIAALAKGADAYCIKGSRIERLVEAIAAAQSGAVYLDAQVRHVVAQLKPLTPNQPIASLSQREMEILQLVVEGHSNPEIAAQLFLSESTVKTHLRNIMNKFNVDDRVQVAVVALRSGLV